MTTNAEVAREKPVASMVDLFDSLMTISFLTKALAKSVLLLSTEKDAKGGNEDDKKTLNFSSK